MSPQTVLILSREPTVGALLGIYVELCGHRPLFAAAGQGDTDAVGQSDPAVILVELDADDETREAFFARQVADGRSVVLFGSEQDGAESLATQRGLPFIAIPVTAASFCVALERATRAAEGKRRPTT